MNNNLSSVQNLSGAGTSQSIIAKALKYTAALRLPGGQSSFISANATTLTSYVKLEAEAPFTQVRLWFFNKATTAANGFRAIVAPTETNLRDTQANRYSPIQAAAANNGLFKPVLFGGAATGVLPAGVASPFRLGVLASDWLTIGSVPRADGGTKPLLIVRTYQDAAAQGNNTVTSGFTSDLATNWSTASAQPFFRVFQAATLGASDGVTTLANMPAVDYGGSFNWPHFIGVEFRYAVPARAVVAVGDSITEGGGGQAFSFDSWLARAVLTKSTPAAPMQSFNAGISGQNSAEYFQEFDDLLAKGLLPTDAIFAGFTPNDGSPIDASVDARMVALNTRLNTCKAQGIKAYVWTGLPNNGYSGVAEAARVRNNTLIKALSPSLSTVLDFDFIASDGANPAKFKPGYNQPDGIHPSATLIALLANTLQAAL